VSNVALQRNTDQVVLAASTAIRTRMELGSQKYDPCVWRSESVRRHIRHAIKHAVTELEIADGDHEIDDDDHLAAAVCRMSMALAVRNQPAETIDS